MRGTFSVANQINSNQKIQSSKQLNGGNYKCLE